MASGKYWKVGVLVVSVIMTAALFAGCLGGDDDDKPQLVQTGSSTVLPLAIAWAQEYEGADIVVSGGGSSHGLNSLLLGEADLGDASRLMKGSDYEKVDGDPSLVTDDGTATGKAPTGVWPKKWVVAYDVLTVVVNNDNDYATQLNYTQLYKIFTDDDPAVHWDEVPGLEDAPHEEIEIYAPDEASGTYDYFFEEIIPRWGKDDQVANSRLAMPDTIYHPSADDNVILRAIKENEFAIGFFGYAYYAENTNAIRSVAVAEDDDTYVPPSMEAVADYPMARPLYIYTDGVPEPGDAVNEYLRYILGEEGQSVVPEVGYVRLSLVDPGIVTSQLAELD